MNELRYESGESSERLQGFREARGGVGRSGPWGLFLMSLPFVGLGLLIVLVGLGVVPSNPARVRVPYGILTVFGSLFLAAGLWLLGQGFRAWGEHRRRQALRSPEGEQDAMADYPWDQRGFAVSRWRRPRQAVIGAIFFTLFMAGFNWWAFGGGGPMPLKIVVGLFDAIGLLFWGRALLLLARAVKFGESRLQFVVFPYCVGETAVLHWYPPRGLAQASRGSFTLRCVKEWYESSGTRRERSKELVHEQLWRGAGTFSEPRRFQPGDCAELRFAIPKQLPGTELSAERPVFWELEVKLDLAGIDFYETYLVPVYEAS